MGCGVLGTGSSWIVSGGRGPAGFAGSVVVFFIRFGWVVSWVAGVSALCCLTISSEERETWAAVSLRFVPFVGADEREMTDGHVVWVVVVWLSGWAAIILGLVEGPGFGLVLIVTCRDGS